MEETEEENHNVFSISYMTSTCRIYNLTLKMIVQLKERIKDIN